MSRWLCDERVSRFYGGEHHRFSPEAAQTHYEACLEEDDMHLCFLVLQEEPVGFLQYYRVPEVSDYQLEPGDMDATGLWACDLFIGEPELWGKGHGRVFIALLLRHLFDERGALRVLIDPIEDNTRAIRAYGACGFEPVKRLIGHEEHDGVWRDCLLMCASSPARWRR